MKNGSVQFSVIDPNSAMGLDLAREYIFDIAGRYYGRAPSPAEMDSALADLATDKLVDPAGLLVMATLGDSVLGCGGIRLLPAGIGELTRIYVRPSGRGQGIGAALVLELERLAREREISKLQLDTRSDLVEARRLYARMGFTDIPAFNSGPFAQHWLGKDLI